MSRLVSCRPAYLTIEEEHHPSTCGQRCVVLERRSNRLFLCYAEWKREERRGGTTKAKRDLSPYTVFRNSGPCLFLRSLIAAKYPGLIPIQ